MYHIEADYMELTSEFGRVQSSRFEGERYVIQSFQHSH